MKIIKLTTTGTADPVFIADLGAVYFDHPTNDFVLTAGWTLDELQASTDLQNSLAEGEITLRDAHNINIVNVIDFITGNFLTCWYIETDQVLELPINEARAVSGITVNGQLVVNGQVRIF